MNQYEQFRHDVRWVFLFCVGVFVVSLAALAYQSLTTGPASADIAELRREKQMIQLCEDAIRTQQVVKRGPYEARPYGDRCAVYQLVYSGGG